MPPVDLRAELGANPPDGLVAALSQKELGALAAAVGEAKQRQRLALDKASKDALSHLPWVVRKAVQAVLR